MAVAKTATGIIEIRGSVAGTVYRHTKQGQSIQSTPRNVRRAPSSQQKRRRDAFRTCINYLKTNTNDDFVARWKIYGSQHPTINKMGESSNLTWFQAFMSINVIRIYNEVAIIQYPP